MSTSIFCNKAEKPEAKDITEVLGAAEQLWNNVKNYISESFSETLEEWKFYGKTSGWTLLIKHKKRTILYLFPNSSFFIVSFVFGGRAVQEALASPLPSLILEKIENAISYMEGKSFQVEVRTEEDVENVKKLIHIRINN